MSRAKRDPWQYGGHGMAVAALVLNIVALVSFVPMGMIAAIAIPNLLASVGAANEGAAQSSLRTLHAAEATYQATKGAGNFGTLSELSAGGLDRLEARDGHEEWLQIHGGADHQRDELPRVCCGWCTDDLRRR